MADKKPAISNEVPKPDLQNIADQEQVKKEQDQAIKKATEQQSERLKEGLGQVNQQEVSAPAQKEVLQKPEASKLEQQVKPEIPTETAEKPEAQPEQPKEEKIEAAKKEPNWLQRLFGAEKKEEPDIKNVEHADVVSKEGIDTEKGKKATEALEETTATTEQNPEKKE